MFRQVLVPDLGIVVDVLARFVSGLDDGRVWRDDEGLLLLGRVEHLAVALESQRAGTFLSSVSFVEVDDEAYDPRESDAASGDGTGYDWCFGPVAF